MAFVERKAGARVGMQYEAASVPLRSLDRTSARCRCLSFFLSGSNPSPRVFSAFSCFPSYEKHSAGLSVSEPANQTGQKEQRHYRERETWNGCPPPMTTCFSFLFSSSSRRRRALPTRASHSHPPLSIYRPFSFSTPNQLVYQNKKKNSTKSQQPAPRPRSTRPTTAPPAPRRSGRAPRSGSAPSCSTRPPS